jgi:Domain of unknown function (DUF4062)
MKTKKLQISVSSTYTDLKDEGQAAVEAILSSGHIPAGRELFKAGDESQMAVTERWIDESDVYLFIPGGRYGSLVPRTGKSYTQLEYEYALSKSKPLFSVVISSDGLDEKLKVSGRAAIEELNNKELKAFRSNVLTKLVKFFDDTKDIKIAIHETLADFSYRKDLAGWVRGDNSANIILPAEEIARLTKENIQLKSQIQNSDNHSSSLYAGLSYSQLEILLKRQKLIFLDKEISFFEFFVSQGQDLARGEITFSTSEDDSHRVPYEQLQTYKLVAEIGDNTEYRYKFSEDGHNFYLKSLLCSQNDIANPEG